MRLTLLLALAVTAGLALAGGSAHAYPQFQLSTGADRCQQCHFSPGGGGLINEYGRSEAGDTISQGGDGAFLHGLWSPPEWLQLGGDYRSAGGLRQETNDLETMLFPMQADLYLRLGFGPISVYVAGGGRAAPREPTPALIDRLASREHYVLYQPESAGLYVRAGRFYPIFGLRLQDHTTYIRRFQDLYLLEEPYGVSAGWFGEGWEGHAMVYGPQPSPYLGAAPRAFGGTLYYERRALDDTAAWAAQARVAATSEDVEYTAGGIGKLWLEGAKLMLLGELDVALQTFDVGPAREKVTSYLGATYFAMQGLMVGAAVNVWEPDVTLSGSSRSAADLNVQYFPWAHFELHLLGRIDARALDLGDPGFLGLLMFHYYL